MLRVNHDDAVFNVGSNLKGVGDLHFASVLTPQNCSTDFAREKT
jgi:hypothetical protein